MNDILKIIFSIFDSASEYSLNKDNENKLSKKHKRIAYSILLLVLTISFLIIYFIEVKN